MKECVRERCPPSQLRTQPPWRLEATLAPNPVQRNPAQAGRLRAARPKPRVACPRASEGALIYRRHSDLQTMRGARRQVGTVRQNGRLVPAL
eukprot:scaffold316257_cov32-Tisochrysis_lutea.AAC.1